MELRNNTYWVLRHGRSKANEASIIVSSLENGVKEEYALAEAGRQQAREAGALLASELRRAGLGPERVVVYASPFSRALETARLAAGAAGVDAGAIQVAPELRERFFGAALELESHDNYCPAWAADEKDPSSRPGGDGESVAGVAARILGLLQELEARHEGCAILLVSHGDTLSITQAAAGGTDLRGHRGFGMGTAELRRLRGPGGAAGAAAPALAAAVAARA
ncbi:MAG: phosphoglycerate mutase [Monoraphidium minutum]|nr:MAG: phosphoglycerate mutase [Monoraphidium minutum]